MFAFFLMNKEQLFIYHQLNFFPEDHCEEHGAWPKNICWNVKAAFCQKSEKHPLVFKACLGSALSWPGVSLQISFNCTYLNSANA